MASMTPPTCGKSTAHVKGDDDGHGKHTALATVAGQAYSAAMDSAASIEATRALWQRMERRLQKLGLSVRAADSRARSKDAIRNVKRASDEGKAYSPRAVTLDAIAVALRTSPEWLLHEMGPEEIEDVELARAALRLVSDKGTGASRKIQREAAQPTAIREIEIHAGLGGGGVPAQEMVEIIGDESYGVDAVRGYWSFPEHALRTMRIDPSFADIVPGVGDSMEPDIRNGDWCVIDRRHRVPSPDGIYALWDGFSVVFKSLQIVPNSDPVRVRIISKNSAYVAYERQLGEIAVIGRVVSLIRSI